MPTKKADTAVEENIAVGEAKPKRAGKRAGKAAAPELRSENGANGANGAAAAPKTTRRRSTALARTAEEPGTGVLPPLSPEDISVRAYFIGEHRRALGLGGDSESDWLEAERQLKSERLGIAASLRRK